MRLENVPLKNELTCPPTIGQEEYIVAEPFLLNGVVVPEEDIAVIKGSVYKKTGGRCRYCKNKLKIEEMIMTRKILLSRGGSNEIKNLFPACLPCVELKWPKIYAEIRRNKKRMRKRHERKMKDVTKKQEILDKTNGLCAYCGAELSLESMTVDHIIPISCGGNNNLRNLAPACSTCNNLKDSMPIEEFNAMISSRRESEKKKTEDLLTSFFMMFRRMFHNIRRKWNRIDRRK